MTSITHNDVMFRSCLW